MWRKSWVESLMRGILYRIGNQLYAGKQLQDIDVPLRLLPLKPCHAEWLIECYNHMATTAAQNVIQSGWKAAGIAEALQVEVTGLGSLDTFQEIDPFNWAKTRWKQCNFQCYRGCHSSFKVESVDTQYDCDSGSDSQWENGDEIDFERNEFDAFDDKPDF